MYNTRIIQTLSGVTIRVLTIIALLAGLVAVGPSLVVVPAQAADKPTPMIHTIDYVLVSSTDKVDFLTIADLEERTKLVSEMWNRISRGVVKEIKLGRVFRLTNYKEDLCQSTPWSYLPSVLGYSFDVYQNQPNGRHLAFVAKSPDTNTCMNTHPGWGDVGRGLSDGGMLAVLPEQLHPIQDAAIIAHELGHNFGLGHAAAVPDWCNQRYWDGPFVRDFVNNYAPDGCTLGEPQSLAAYTDGYNIMGKGVGDTADINGANKNKLGLIQSGVGLQNVTAGDAEQLITINDSRTQDLNLLQTIRLTGDDPDGDGPCKAPVYYVDYDHLAGGVRVFRVPIPMGCGSEWLAALDSVVWTTGGGYSTFLPGESRLTQSGKVQIRVVRVDADARTATVGIRRTDTGFTTLQLTSSYFRNGNAIQARASGSQAAITVTTNQPPWTATSNQSWATVTASGQNGTELVAAIAPNPTAVERKAIVTVKANSVVQTFSITQAKGPSQDDCPDSGGFACRWPELGSPVRGKIESSGDYDAFDFTAPVTGTWSFIVSGAGTGGLPSPAARMICRANPKPSTSVQSIGNNQIRMTAELKAGWQYLLEVSGGNSVGTYTVTAAGPTANITVAPSTWNAAGNGDSKEIVVTSNTAWLVGALPNWLHSDYTKPTGTTIIADPNMTGQPRTVQVPFSAQGRSVSLSVSQSPGSASADDCGATTSTACTEADLSSPTRTRIDYRGDRDWFKFTPKVTGTWSFTLGGFGMLGTMYAADGITQVQWDQGPQSNSPMKVTVPLIAGSTYYLEVASSQVSGDYTANGGYTVTAGPPAVGSISVSSGAWSAPDIGGTKVIQVTSSSSWKLTLPAWITANPSSGVGNAAVTLTASPNTTGHSRTWSAVFTITTHQATVTVTQAAQPIISVSPTSWAAPDIGGIYSVRVATKADWKLNVPSWITASDTSGTEDTTVILTAQANTTGATRAGSLTFTITGKQATVPVTQPAQPVPPVDDCGGPGTTGCAWTNVATPVTGRIETTGDVDRYKITAAASGYWTFTLSSPATGGTPVPYFTLRQADGTTMAYTWGGPGSSCSVTSQLVANTTYYLDVLDINSHTGSYKMTATAPAAQTISVSPGTWTAPEAGGSAVVQVTTDLSWSLTLPTWVTASAKAGTGNAQVTLTVKPNTTGAARSGSAVVAIAGKQATMSVAQGGEPSISVSPGSLTAPWSGGTRTVEVAANTPWQLTVPDWIAATPRSGTGNVTVTVTVLANTTQAARKGSLAFTTTAGKQTTVSAAQDASPAPFVTVLPDSWTAPNTGGTTTVRVTASALPQLALPDWINASFGANSHYSVSLTAERNDTGQLRTASVVFTVDGKQAKVTVQQAAAPTITASPDALLAPFTSGTQTVQVRSNAAWQLSNVPAWITAKPMSGVGDATVTLTFTPNTTQQARMQGLEFTVAGKQAVVWVTQSGQPLPDISVSIWSWTPACNGGSQVVQVKATAPWQLKLPNWISANPGSGTGDATVTLTAQANPTTVVRTDIVKFGITGKEATVSVTQVGQPTISVSPNSWAAPPSGGSRVIDVAANAPWKMILPPWVSANQVSGTGNTEGRSTGVTLTAQPNTTGVARNGIVTFSVDGKQVTMDISQAVPPVKPSGTCGDSSATACTWVNLPIPVQESIETGGDKDWFKITPTTSGDWTFTSSVPATGGTPDPYGALRAADGTIIAQDDQGGGNNQFSITTKLVAGTTYYLEVYDRSATNTGAYIVTATPPGVPLLWLSQSTWSVPNSGGNMRVEVTTNSAWELKLPDWIITPYAKSGTGNATLLLQVSANATGQARNASVVFTITGKQATISVTQAVDPTRTITVSPTSWTAPGKGGSATVKVSSAAAWTSASSLPLGVSMSPSSGGAGDTEVTFTATSNNTSVDRYGSVVLKAGVQQVVVTVTQPFVPTVSVSPGAAWSPASTGGTLVVKVTSNSTWKLALPTWITASPATGAGDATVTLTAVANPTTAARAGTVKFSVTGMEVSFAVSQVAGPVSITVSPTQVTAPAGGGDVMVTVSSNAAWSVVTSLPAWITAATPASGSAGDPKVTLSTTANTTGVSRTGTVSFKAGDKQATVTVTQAAQPVVPTISVSPPSWSAPNIGGTQTVQVTANAPWAMTLPAWITATPASGNGNATVTLTAVANNTTAARTGTVTFSVPGKQATVTVTQAVQVDDCGVTAATACTWANLATAVNGRIEVAGDKDWFKITPTVSGTWTFKSAVPTTGGTPGPSGILRTAEGTTLAWDSVYSGHPQFVLTANLVAGTTYYLEVGEMGSSSTGSYTVTAARTA